MVEVSIIEDFDLYLSQQKLSFEAIVIGGAALKLLGLITRQTIDCDILDPKIPAEIMQASRDFADTQSLLRKSDLDLNNWLNNGPDSLVNYLPTGWRHRLQPAFQGTALTLHTLGRSDLIATKLSAYCDRGRDRFDLIEMNATRAELLHCPPWVQAYDNNPGWPNHVIQQFQELAKELGYEL